MIYFDNNATTAPAPEVVEAVRDAMTSHWANPSSLHAPGADAQAAVERARADVAALINASPSEIIFTSGGTESDNLAIRGLSPRAFVTSSVEHPAVAEPAAALKAMGVDVAVIGVDTEGQLDLDGLDAALAKHPETLLSIMWANSETGVISPMHAVVELARKHGAVVHTDAVQAAGRIPVDVASVGVDLLSLAGHKLHGPKGVGALFVRRGTRLAPLLRGGSQEGGRRAGTLNVPGIIGLGCACRLAREHMDTMTAVARHRDRLEAGLLSAVPEAVVNAAGASRLPNTASISFTGSSGEALLYELDDAGIAVSTGSACSSGTGEPSRVLTAMKLPRARAEGTLRFSLSRYTTDGEITATIAALCEILASSRTDKGQHR